MRTSPIEVRAAVTGFLFGVVAAASAASITYEFVAERKKLWDIAEIVEELER